MIEFIVDEPEPTALREPAVSGRKQPDAIAWAAQPGPQSDLCSCPYTEIFFGGARGGGKTDGVLGKWALKERRYGQHFNAIMFRRTSVSAEDAIERSREIYAPLGGRFNETKLRWRMPNGGRVAFAYLENTADANEYQGRNVTDAWVEEAGQYPTPSPIDRLFGVLRSSHGVPIQLILTANPGGPGQHWIRQRYQIHPFPKRPIILTRTLANGHPHRVAVIPSRITDNKILMRMDPGYVDRLHMVGSPQLVRAWLEGDWSAIEGAFFTEWDEGKHVIPAFALPESWLRFRSADWGSFSPFVINWWAVAGDDYAFESALHRSGTLPGAREDLLGTRLLKGTELASNAILGSDRDGKARDGGTVSRDTTATRIIPRGALICYREWYGAVGGKLTAEQVAEGIAVREKGDRQRLTYGVLDPSAFIESGGPSIAENMNRILTMERPSLASFRKADNKRVARNIGDPAKSGPMGGWDQMRQRLKGRNGVPMLYFFPNCSDSIRTIPVLQHDETKLEDLDCWVAGTMVATPSGDVPIELIKVGDLVETPLGPRPVLRSYLSGAGGTIWILLSDGRQLQGTAHHKIYIQDRGLLQLSELMCYDIPQGRIMSWQRKSLSIAVSFTHAIQAVFTTIQTERFSRRVVPVYIDKFGLMPGEQFPPVGMFTTSMKTTTIMSLETLSVCRQVLMDDYIFKNGLLANSGRNSQNGERARQAGESSATMPVRCTNGRRSVHRRAAIVDALLRRDILLKSIARKSVAKALVIDSLKRFARVVASCFGQSGIQPKKSEPVHIVAVGYCAEKTQVYNLTVDDAHMFYANGVLSSNTEAEDHCADSVRYACMSRPWIKAMPLPERPKDSYRPAQEERNDSDSVLLL